MMKEKRKYRRHRILVPVSFRSTTKNLYPNWVLTEDVSQNGIRVRAGSSLAKGRKVKVEIEIPGRLFLIKAVGHIKWTKQVAPASKKQSSRFREMGMQIIFPKPLDAEVWKRFIHHSSMVANLAN